MQAFGFKKRQINFLPVYIPSLGVNWKHDRLHCSVCVRVRVCVCLCVCVVLKGSFVTDKKGVQVGLPSIFKMATSHA